MLSSSSHAANVLNSLNRQTALWIIQPTLSGYLPRSSPTLIEGMFNCSLMEVLLSQEGTIQGDPLALVMYALAITTLIHHFEERKQARLVSRWCRRWKKSHLQDLVGLHLRNRLWLCIQRVPFSVITKTMEFMGEKQIHRIRPYQINNMVQGIWWVYLFM